MAQFKLNFLVKRRTGIGEISACGGDGFAGGGGGRVSVDIFSRHEDPKIYAYGINQHHTLLYLYLSLYIFLEQQ